ncbi:MAG: hypothetical protein V3U60_13395 [Gammaproteobacteria bacterium]
MRRKLRLSPGVANSGYKAEKADGKPSQFGLHSDIARYLLKFTDFAIGSLVLRMRTARQ